MIEYDDVVENILGRPNFMCANIAELLRKKGFEIKHKAEIEQAQVLYWMLTMYEKHGDDMEKQCNDFLRG